MKKRVIILLSFISILIGITSIFIYRNKLLNDDNLININDLSDEFIEKYKQDLKKLEEENNKENNDKENILIVTSKNEIKNNYGATVIVEAPNNQYFLQYESKYAKEKAMKEFKKEYDDIIVEENKEYKFSEDNSSNKYNSWGIEKMGLDYASSYINGKKVDDVVVAIIDTGCDMELFEKNYSNKIYKTYNILTSKENDMYDNEGHGTHIAGTIAEGTPDNVKIMPVKVSDSKSLYTDDIIKAINHIILDGQVDVINMSFGNYTNEESLYTAIDAAKKNNIICVAAAGNEYTSDKSYPAAYDNTISVSAVDENMMKADFSNYGNTISFAAPGVGITSINGTYNGTSMAAPHVVSSVAILKSLQNNLNFEQVIEELKLTATDLGAKGYDIYFGNGFIDFNNISFCENPKEQTCDENDVFKKIIISNIEITTPKLTEYNYGSLTNILATEVTVYNNDGSSQNKALWELEDAKISGYDPYSNVKQVINVEYLDYKFSFEITNPTDYESGWEYTFLPDSTITITKYKDHLLGIDKLYFPNEIDGYLVSELSDGYGFSLLFNESQDTSSYKEVFLPSSIRKIGQFAFVDFKNVYKVTSEAESVMVSSCAFCELPYLKEFNGVVSFNEYYGSIAFYGDKMLEKIKISSDTDVIPNQAFLECESLTSVDLPDKLESIRDGAFSMTGLEKIEFPSSLIELGNNSFLGTKLKNVFIPKNIISIGMLAFGNEELENLVVSSDNKIYDSRENSNAIIETSTNKLINATNNTIIPNSVKTIGTNAFYYTNITELSIPEGVETIEEHAFVYNDFLEKLELPNSLQSIDPNSFIIYDTFNGRYSKYNRTVFFVHNDSISYQYVSENELPYKIIENESIDWEYDFWELHFSRHNYKPYERFEDDEFELIIYYNNMENYEIVSPENITVEYEEGRDSFRYGDYRCFIKYNTINGINNLVIEHYIIVDKNIPSFEIPTGLKGKKGNKLSSIELPDNFEWMDENIIIDTLGEQTFKAKYIPTDEENYETIENIEIPVFVESKEIIYPEIKINDKVYDGTKKISTDSIQINNLNKDDYIVVEANSDVSDVGKTNSKIKIKLNDEKYLEYEFEGGVQEKVFDVELTIIKADPIVYYETSNKDVKYDGNNHGLEIKVTNFENAIVKYIDKSGNYSLDKSLTYSEIGEYIIKFKIIINDNYNDYFGEEKLIISNKSISNNTKDKEIIYDGNEHTIDIDINVDNYDINYIVDNINYAYPPKFKDVGEYTINYKITSPGYETLTGSNKVKIYGIKKFDPTIEVRDNILITKNNSFSNLINKIDVFSFSTSFYHMNKNDSLTNLDTINTGDNLEITINNASTFKYYLSIIGDVSGDGKISSADYVKIRKHIMQTEIINDNIYFYSADITKDNKITSADYIRIRKYIMNGESL